MRTETIESPVGQQHVQQQVPPFGETEVTFANHDAGITLSATLTLPDLDAPVPAVVFVHGSGPLDRDENGLGHKPFRVIAHHLGAHGVASLRFDKRGVGRSQGSFDSATLADFADDVIGAVESLSSTREVDAERVGLVGHSEGGMTALTAAAESTRISQVVMLGSPVLSGKENLACALATLAIGDFERGDRYEEIRTQVGALVDMVLDQRRTRAESKRMAVAAELLAPVIVNDRTTLILGTNHMSGEELVGLLSSPCLGPCLSWEPATTVPQVDCAVLALYGSKDVQVPSVENAEMARRILADAGTSNYTVETVADANHLFQDCTTGMPSEYESIDHTISKRVLDRVTSWVLA